MTMHDADGFVVQGQAAIRQLLNAVLKSVRMDQSGVLELSVGADPVHVESGQYRYDHAHAPGLVR